MAVFLSECYVSYCLFVLYNTGTVVMIVDHHQRVDKSSIMHIDVGFGASQNATMAVKIFDTIMRHVIYVLQNLIIKYM